MLAEDSVPSLLLANGAEDERSIRLGDADADESEVSAISFTYPQKMLQPLRDSALNENIDVGFYLTLLSWDQSFLDCQPTIYMAVQKGFKHTSFVNTGNQISSSKKLQMR